MTEASSDARSAIRAILEKKDYDILLDADEYWKKSGGRASKGRAAFKLAPSGRCYRQYLSLWELFDHQDALLECGEYLVRKIQEIRRKTAFTTIVTCTPPSKLLAQLFHSKIEATEDGVLEAEEDEDRKPENSRGELPEDVKLRHVGAYPVHECTEELHAFKGETVLILADVIATGSVVRTVSKVVQDLGGEPVAILAVVLTNREWIEEQNEKGLVARAFGKDGTPIGIHSLTTYRIDSLKKDEFDAGFTLEIDPDLALPEEVPNAHPIRPLFDSGTMFQHVEDSLALGFNFYRVEAQKFTVALRIPLFFEKCGDEIWGKISESIGRDSLLVSTYSRTDILFRDLVEKKITKPGRERKPCVLLPRKDTHTGTYSYYLPPAPKHKKALRGKNVVLLLTSVQTAEKLRSIASILASEKVNKITVICIFNRMGIHTADFVSRVRTLLSGIGRTAKESRETLFEFCPVYNIREVSTSQIHRMQTMTEKLFNEYTKNTRVDSFRRLATNYRKYFRSRPVSSNAFLQERPIPLAEPRSIHFIERLNGSGAEQVEAEWKTEVTLKTEEGVLFCHCANLSLTRDYSALIHELCRVEHKETIFKIFGILLSDIYFIRLKGNFSLLFDVICERLDKIANERFEIEEQVPRYEAWTPELREKIQKNVELEIYFIFGLALFSFLDEDHEDKVYRDIVFRLLNFGKESEEWVRRYPLNLLIYLGEDRIVWALSMLLHLAFPDFNEMGANSDLKKNLKDEIRVSIKHFDKLEPESFRSLWDAIGWKIDMGRLKLKKLRVNLNSLLIEIGAYEIQTRYSVLRFLHKELISQTLRHSPISGTLQLVLRKIRELIFEPLGDSRKYSHARRISFRRKIETTRALQPLLEDGMYIAGKLQEVAEAAHRLFEFTSISRNDAKMFAIDSGASKFEDDIHLLGDIIERSRVENAISLQDLEKAEELNLAVSTALWDRYSPLQQVLRSYIVDLLEVLVSTMQEVNRQLAATEGFKDSSSTELKGVYSEEIARFSPLIDVEHWDVLVDRLLLREVLRNILGNVRHGIRRISGKPDENIDYASLVKLELEDIETVENNVTKMRWVRLTLVSPGPYKPSDEETTLAQHALEIAEYGGSDGGEEGGALLEARSSADGLHTITTLQLRSRKEVGKRLRDSDRRMDDLQGESE